MEPVSEVGHVISEHFTGVWAIAIAAAAGAASWAGAQFAIRNNAKRTDKLETRVTAIELSMVHVVTSANCKAATGTCKEDRELVMEGTNTRLDAIAESTNSRLDKIMDMFARLEERRNERWLDFEHRRETSKAELQKTLTDMTKQLSCLQGVISERDKRYRKTNGDKGDE